MNPGRAIKDLVAQVEAAVFSALRRAIYARARDLTAVIGGRATLVIAPHPDDETLGCGATVARIRDCGHGVRVLVVSDGRDSHQSAKITPDELVALRRAEALAACAELGIASQDVRFLDLPDGQLENRSSELRAGLLREIAAFGPQQLLYPSGLDSHTDHQAVAQAVEGLLRDGSVACPAYGYPVWFWKFRLWLRRFGAASVASTRAVKVSAEAYLPCKRSALAAHRSQFENITQEAGWRFLRSNFTRHFVGPYEIFFEFDRG